MCVLNSLLYSNLAKINTIYNHHFVERSIDEFVHVNMARWMGYGKEFQDMKINIHISGRHGAKEEKYISHLKIDFNTYSILQIIFWGPDSQTNLTKHLALVLDIHKY